MYASGMAKHISLDGKERKELEQMLKSGMNSVRVIGRARVLLLLDRSQGKQRTIQEVVEAAMVSPGTVSNLKKTLLRRRHSWRSLRQTATWCETKG